MSSRRIDKLVKVKEMAVEAAEGALRSARAQVTAAEHAVAAMEQTWTDAMARAATASTPADLMDVDARGRTLRQAVLRAEWAVVIKRREVFRQEGLVAEARTELRRFEKWSERAAQTASAQAAVVQRRAEDALAARHGREQS